KGARVRDGQRHFEFPWSRPIRSLLTVDRNPVAIEHEQARSSRHFDEGGVQYRLFLLERAAHFAHGFVAERRTVRDFERNRAWPGGRGDLVGKLAGAVSQARRASRRGKKNRRE